MLYQGRTDIASESLRQAWDRLEELGEKQGIIARVESINQLELTRVEITSDKGAELLGKPRGKYFTLKLPERYERGAEQFQAAVEALARVLGSCFDKAEKVLVAALGNPDITPDALGNLAAGSILVTRHLKEGSVPGFEGFASVALSRPGVLGSSGIESTRQIKLLCRELEPELVIVIDAMAGADMDMLCRCIQVSDTGLAPGSGVGNDRAMLNRESLGVPVVAVGVPTVADAGICCGHDVKGMFVTPRDIDAQVRNSGRIIGYGVNLALHKGLTVADVDMLVG